VDDIPLLVEHFKKKYGEQYKKEAPHLSEEIMQKLFAYHWPGNVRELENMIKRAVVLGGEQAILQDVDGKHIRSEQKIGEDSSALDDFEVELESGEGLDLKSISKRAARIAEKRVIELVLTQTRWNRKEAAEKLQISYKALLYKMKENGLSDGR
jgi:two-component system response regulator AtoC